MRSLMLVLCAGVVSGARIPYDRDSPVQGTSEDRNTDVWEGRAAEIDHHPRHPDVRPSHERYGEAGRFEIKRPLRPPEHRRPGDRSNEITDKNVDRSKIKETTINFIDPTERQPLYADNFKHVEYSVDGRRSKNVNEYRGGDSGGSDNKRYHDVGVGRSRGDDVSRRDEDENTEQETDTSTPNSNRARDKAATKNAQTETGRGSTDSAVGDNSWIWSAETSTTASTVSTTPDLDNRFNFDGANCPTGQAKIAGKCVINRGR